MGNHSSGKATAEKTLDADVQRVGAVISERHNVDLATVDLDLYLTTESPQTPSGVGRNSLILSGSTTKDKRSLAGNVDYCAATETLHNAENVLLKLEAIRYRMCREIEMANMQAALERSGIGISTGALQRSPYVQVINLDLK